MQEDNTRNILERVMKRKRTIVKITLLVVALSIIVSLILPKTYESTSEIQLAQLGQIGQLSTQTSSEDIFSVIESKNVIESSKIIGPAIAKYCPEIEYKDFIEKNLFVNIIKERISKEEKAINYLSISVFYRDAEIAKKLNEEIIKNFFEYAQPYYDERYKVLIKDKGEEEEMIADLEKSIKDTEYQIEVLSNSQLTTEGISKSTLLSSILSGYKARLSSEQDRKNEIENAMVNKREYEIMTYPEAPSKPSNPNIYLDILIGLIVGIILSVFYVFTKKK